MANVYNTGKINLVNDVWLGWEDIAANQVGIALFDNRNAFTHVATHALMSSITGHANNDEVDVADISLYARKAVATRSIVAVGNEVEHRANSTLFATLGTSGAARLITHAVIYFLGTANVFDTSNDATTNIPICSFALSSTVTTNGGDVTIQYDGVADGAVFNYID